MSSSGTAGANNPSIAGGSGLDNQHLDVQASHQLSVGGNRNLTLVADVFNLFNRQTVTMYDQWTELTGPVPNPDFGAPITQVLAGAPPQFRVPRQVRLGAGWSF